MKTHKTPVDQRREVRNAQAAKRRLKYHSKLKNERQTLQEQEQTLSDVLSHLQQARTRVKSLQQESVAVPVWKAIATRQMEGRLVAEEQQRRLRSAVAHRSQVISELGEIMRLRLFGSKDPTICADTEKATSECSLQLNADDKALFEDYLHDVEAVYARTDDVFQSCGAEENPVMSYRTGLERKRDGVMEYLDVMCMPFAFEQTCSAMWQSMVHVHRQKDRKHYEGIIDPENTIAAKFRLRCLSEKGEPVNMIVHMIMRRYVEAHRMVLVWRALSEGEGDFSGMHSDETGWSIVRPNDTDEDDMSPMRTVMQTFVRFVPMNIANTSLNEVDSDHFTKLVVTSVEEDAAEIARMMDSLLIQDEPDEDIAEHNSP